MADPSVNQVIELQQRATAARKQREDAAQDLVKRIQQAREDISTRVGQLYEMSTELRTISRRNLDEGSQSYVLFANAHMRLAGALSQGFRRTASADRVLKVGQAEREEASRREEADRQWREAREQQKVAEKLTLATDNDFDELYGDVVDAEVVNA